MKKNCTTSQINDYLKAFKENNAALNNIDIVEVICRGNCFKDYYIY